MFDSEENDLTKPSGAQLWVCPKIKPPTGVLPSLPIQGSHLYEIFDAPIFPTFSGGFVIIPKK